jgi:hypothetical protein
MWGPWRRVAALVLVLALLPGCQVAPAQIYIPAAYAATGLCVALLVSPTVTAGIVGLVVGALLGAAVYNNSLKRALLEPKPGDPASPR